MKLTPNAPVLFATVLALAAGCANVDGNSGIGPATYDTGSKNDSAAASDTGGGTTDTAGSPDTTSGGTDAASEDAGPVGTCEGACGGKYDPSRSCQCNDDCPKFGNCCPDYGALCKPEEMTCKGRCDSAFNAAKPCQCTWDCPKYGTCCPDWIAQCHADEQLDFFYAPSGKCTKDSDWKKVDHVSDGDTLVLEETDSKGQNLIVRFLLVDTPELTSSDCYALEAKKFTYAQVQKSQSVCLISDSKAGNKDVYGRLLRYVYYKEPAVDGKAVELNLRLLRLGYARVLYPFAKGNQYESLALMTMGLAKENNVGGWAKCGWLKPK